MVVLGPMHLPEVEALRRLHISTKNTAQRLRAFSIASSLESKVDEDLSIPPLNFPLPSETLGPILRLDAPEKLKSAIRESFMLRFAELQAKYTTGYKDTFAIVMQTTQRDPNPSLQAAFLNLYRRHCHTLVQAQVPYVLKELDHISQSILRRDTTKSEFNHVCMTKFDCFS